MSSPEGSKGAVLTAEKRTVTSTQSSTGLLASKHSTTRTGSAFALPAPSATLVVALVRSSLNKLLPTQLPAADLLCRCRSTQRYHGPSLPLQQPATPRSSLIRVSNPGRIGRKTAPSPRRTRL